ncbi:MAG: hypothetical protein ACRDDZ_12430 [Marinifilaceae bacterium]
MKHLFVYIFLFLLTPLCGFTQSIEYGAMVDTVYMMIGDQQNFTIKVKSPATLQVDFPVFKDTIPSVPGGVEVLKGPFIDSVKLAEGGWMYEGRYLITAFDTGVYTIPSLPIRVAGDGYDNILHTEPVEFGVNTFEVDEQKGSYDIFLPLNTPLNFAEIWPYIAWGLLAIVVIGLIIWVIWRYKTNRPVFAKQEPVIPPFDKAMEGLNGIKGQQLWQAGKEKEYYTNLTEVLRQYIEDELQISAMEMTTSEIMQALKDNTFVAAPNKDALRALLETADYVKFAQMKPLQDENSRFLDVAYKFVEQTNDEIVKEKMAEAARIAEAEEEDEEMEGSGNL